MTPQEARGLAEKALRRAAQEWANDNRHEVNGLSRAQVRHLGNTILAAYVRGVQETEERRQCEQDT